jgi:general secretion pathway protein G
MGSRRSAAFTLIEILTVISILTLLAAIMFPVLVNTKDAAKRTSCQSNLQQIGVAMALYAADYDDRLPYAIGQAQRDHPWSISDYVGKFEDIPDMVSVLSRVTRSQAVFRCPNDQLRFSDPQVNVGPFPSYYAYARSSYMFDVHLGVPLAKVASDPFGSLAYDENHCWHTQCPVDNVYEAKLNRLFGDGHVGFVP